MEKKLEKANKDLEEINRQLKELEKQGLTIDFAGAAAKSVEKILGIVAKIDAKEEKQYFEAGSFKQGPKTRIDYKLGVQFGLNSIAPKEVVQEKPLLQVFEEKNKIRIVAHFPGVKEKNIVIEINGNELLVKIHEKGFEEKIRLPENMRLLEKSFKNGVLELLLEKLF